MPIRPLSSILSVSKKPWSISPRRCSSGDLDLLEDQLGGVGRVQPHLLDLLAGAEAGRAALDDERGQPLGLLLGAGRREHDEDLADRALRDEGLRAVDDPRRPPLRTARVRAAPASEPEPGSVSPQPPSTLPLARRGQVLLLLRLVAGQEDVPRAQRVVRRHRQPDRGVGARDLLERDHVVVELHPGAAVLLGDLHAEQAHLAQRRDDLVREALLLVPAARVRDDEALAHLAHGGLQDALVVGELEVDHGFGFGLAGLRLGAGWAARYRSSGPAGAKICTITVLSGPVNFAGVRLVLGDVQRLVGLERESSRCRR